MFPVLMNYTDLNGNNLTHYVEPCCIGFGLESEYKDYGGAQWFLYAYPLNGPRELKAFAMSRINSFSSEPPPGDWVG